MKNPNAKSFDSPSRRASLIGLLCVGLVALAASVKAIEDPLGCGLASGGAGSGHQGGINFHLTQAHIGDLVPVFPSLGMVINACRAIDVTGTVYIATGPLTNFLENAVLDPGLLVSCPANAICQPGPYNILITPALVGASVSTPLGCVSGAANTVRVVENASGRVLAGREEPLFEFNSDSIEIVSPGIEVFKAAYLPPGQSCFAVGAPIRFTGYVTNTGDIRLINITLLDSRTACLFDTTPRQLPLCQPLTLDPGQAVGFQGCFLPTWAETCAGSAASTVTVRGTDITLIGGPNASVTNSTTLSCAICSLNPRLVAPGFTMTREFKFDVTGPAGLIYVIQTSTNPGGPDWLSLCTNRAPFTFVESNALLYPGRFYRAVFQP